MQPTPEYWATVAQASPVFAVGVVVEARAITRSWRPGEQRGYRVFQSLIWAVCLVALGLGEIQALYALDGSRVGAFWADLSSAGIVSAVVTLVVGPAIELFAKGHAEILARAMTSGPLVWLVKLRFSHHLRRRLDRATKRGQHGLVLLARMQSRIVAMEAQVKESGHLECQECQGLLVEIRGALDSLEQQRAKLMETMREVDALHVALPMELASAYGALEAKLLELRRDLTHELMLGPDGRDRSDGQ
jgi:hypothetical protein